MGAMKEIYTETQDLQSAARELPEDKFVEYTEQLGWKSSTEMDAIRRNFTDNCQSGLTMAYLMDPEATHPSTMALGQIVEGARVALGIDKELFYKRMLDSIAKSAYEMVNVGGEDSRE